MSNIIPSNREPADAQVKSALSRDDFSHLTPAQRTALEWLVGGGNITEAAQVAGVCRQTVSNWFHRDQQFRDAYDLWRNETLFLAQGKLTAMADSALQTLVHALSVRHDSRTAQFIVRQLGIGRQRIELKDAEP